MSLTIPLGPEPILAAPVRLRQAHRSTDFSRAVTISLVLHAAIGALLFSGITAYSPPPVAPTMEVSLGWFPAPEAPAPAPEPAAEPTPEPPKPVPVARPRTAHTTPSPVTVPNPPSEPHPALPSPEPVASVPSTEASNASEATRDTSGKSSETRPSGGNHAQPYVIDGPQPPYPAEAREAGHEGKVLVRVLIGEQGRVQDMELRQGSGHASLDKMAMQTLKRWRFRPALLEGRPTATWVVIPVVYALR